MVWTMQHDVTDQDFVGVELRQEKGAQGNADANSQSGEQIEYQAVGALRAKMQYKVAGIPAFFLFKGGEVVTKAVGAMSKDELLAQIEPHLV